MAIKPMLFNTEMVRAILSGQKTCTRRVVKPQPGDQIDADWECGRKSNGELAALTPPCRPGDILYVRETFGDYSECTPGGVGYYMYRADYPDGAKNTVHPDGTVFDLPRWHPSIHMPKDAARLFLRVTDVRVERLQEIDGAGIKAEGTNSKHGFGATRGAFMALWDSTIKPADRDNYGWTANPWIWVIEFERISKEAALGGGRQCLT